MDPLPPDPYTALGVSREASSAEIKTAYRKLALKFHPDKAKDKGEEFHKVQQAYELVGEDDARRKYDDQVRLNSLRRDVYSRRGSNYGPGVDVRTAAYDFRSSPGPAGFQARGPPRYEERRPGGSGFPPRSPYAEEESGDSYFPSRSGSRKDGGFDSTPRKPPPSAKSTPSKSAPRAEETKEAIRQEKASSSKIRNETKKQKDKENSRARKSKFAQTFGRGESDESDNNAGFDTPQLPRRNSAFDQQERPRDGSRDFQQGDARAEKFRSMQSDIKEYMTRSKSEGIPSAERPIPQHARTASAEYARPVSPSPASQAQDTAFEARRSGNDSKSAMFRKAETKKKERSAESPRRSKASPKDTRSKSGDKPPSDERRPPPLYTANSSPSDLKIPKSRSPEELESPTRNSPSPKLPPNLSRSTTMPTDKPPLNRSSTRKGSTTPAVPSGLRTTETHDSGYSTSKSSGEETPQPTTTTFHRYGADTFQVDSNGNEYDTVIRESNRPIRRSPSPIFEPSPRERERNRSRERDRRPLPRTRDSDRGPPPRSASFQSATQQPRNSSDNEREGYTRDARRPSLPQRMSSSQRTSSGTRVPTLPRGASSPMPMRTGSGTGIKQGDLFNEFVFDPDSQQQYYSPNTPGVRRVPDDSEIRFAPRYATEDIKYAPYVPAGQYGSGSSGYWSGGSGRRNSEDIRQTRGEPVYVETGRDRAGPAGPPPGLKRAGTYAY